MSTLSGCSSRKPIVSILPLPIITDTATSQLSQKPTMMPNTITIAPQIVRLSSTPSSTNSLRPTSTATTTLSPTFIPTRSAEEQRKFVLTRLEKGDECQLPCWWGAQPGHTNWSTVEGNYLDNGILPKEYKNIHELHWRIPLQDRRISFGITYVLRSTSNPVVDAIRVGAQMSNEISVIYSREIYELFPQFRLNAILNDYGKPDAVQIFTSGIGNESGQIYYGVVLDYRLSGISILYTGIASVQGDNLLLCPQDTSFDSFLWDPEKSNPNVLFQSKSNLFIPAEYVNLYKELDQVTTLDIDDFYSIYLQPDTQNCLSTPLRYWIP